MKIALINENSQAAKNGIIEAALKKVVEPMGHVLHIMGDDNDSVILFKLCGKLLYFDSGDRVKG